MGLDQGLWGKGVGWVELGSSLSRCVLYRSSRCTSHFIDLVCVNLDYVYGG